MRKIRNKAHRALSVFFATVLVGSGCTKEDLQFVAESEPGTALFSSELTESLRRSFHRDYHEDKIRSTPTADTTLYFESLSPKWEFAVHTYSSSKKKEYLEVPVDAEVAILSEGFGPESTLSTGDEVEVVNSTYLAIEKSVSTGQERAYFISYIPSRTFIDDARSFVHRPGFVPNRFDGVVQYYELNGDYINGYVFEDGKVTTIIRKLSTETNSEHNTRGYECEAKYISERYSWTGLEYDHETNKWAFTTYSRVRSRFVGYDCKYIETPFHYDCTIAPEPGGGGGGSNVEPPEEEPKPCESEDGKRSNPLAVMALAPTSGENYAKGRFGYHRGRLHNGIDLYAEVGTPVFAMMDGVVTRVISTQPDRDEKYPNKKKLPPEYYIDPTNDADDAGNRITIKSEVNGATVVHSYWHLQASNPIEINPATGKPYKVGDRVYQGAIIGYTGRTGNAYNVPNPHLHLSIRKNGKPCNPEEYLIATVTNQSKIDTPCDK